VNGSTHVPARALATVLVVVGASTSPTPAAASDVEATDSIASASQCPSASLCLWSGSSYSGTFTSTFSTAVYNTGIVTARSVRNRALTAARIYSGTNGTGTTRCYVPGANVRSTSVTARSFRILGTTEC
jgi:hypothetical protein